MISPGRLWWLIQRDFRRGWLASYHHYFTLPKISRLRFEQQLPPGPEVPVHLLTGNSDWQLGAWMLASWFRATGKEWRIVIHEDGSLSEEARAALQSIFPKAQFVEKAVADAVMAQALSRFPLCRRYRSEHPLARKIFDVPHFASSRKFLLFDSDLLFFGHPKEILRWTESESEECWFNQDVAESSFVSKEEAKTRLGIDLWPKVNSGLCLLSKSAIDWEFCEKCLRETSVLEGRIWRVEQTLFALCASRHNQGGLLPSTYEVSLNDFSQKEIIARHYVGPIRDRFYADGLPRLKSRIRPSF